VKVVLPYVGKGPHPVTLLVLSGYRPELVDVSADDGYLNLMRRLWKERKPVIIVEHDIVPWPGALEELWHCPCVWGAFSYHLHGGIGVFHGFGCTKITPELMNAVPTVWDAPTPWNMLDQVLALAALNEEYIPHPHRPPVTHLNDRHY
jgi:hypothetical protein